MMRQIKAPITGRVIDVLFVVGDSVAEGDVVAVIESMKLEIPVEADAAGTVNKVHVDVGSVVGEDAVLFTVS